MLPQVGFLGNLLSQNVGRPLKSVRSALDSQFLRNAAGSLQINAGTTGHMALFDEPPLAGVEFRGTASAMTLRYFPTQGQSMTGAWMLFWPVKPAGA